MSDDLLPCPFCGSKDIAYRHTKVLSHPNVVICFRCNATINGSYCNYDDREDLIKKWNTRTIPEEIMTNEIYGCDTCNPDLKFYGKQPVEEQNICERDDFFSQFLRESIEKSIKEKHLREATKKVKV